MLIHEGNWNTGDAYDLVEIGNDIAAHGYFVVAVYYELAPPHYIPGQPCHQDDDPSKGWRMEQETDDIKAEVRALRNDPRCNGMVGVVGGSAGATLAVTVALDKTPTPGGFWPAWCQGTTDDRPDCAAMLSAIYDFSDWTPPQGGDGSTDPSFIRLGMENYAQDQLDPPDNHLDLNTLATLALNPVVLVREAGQDDWGFKPLFLINSEEDTPTAYHQIVTMSCELEAQGLVQGTDFRTFTKQGMGHGFAYWGSQDTTTGQTIGQDVIDFLDAHLKVTH
jgi:acetyl esterase/lipase